MPHPIANLTEAQLDQRAREIAPRGREAPAPGPGVALDEAGAPGAPARQRCPIAASDYRPPWWYRGAHLQTLWGPLFRRPGRLALRRERLATPDGDFLDLDWLDPERPGAPLVVILHGLEGSSGSHYVNGLGREALALGLRAVVMNFRSCSGELNRTLRLYHSGETTDLSGCSSGSASASRRPASAWWACRSAPTSRSSGSASAGSRRRRRVAAAAAISTPFDLARCAAALDVGLRRALYTESFLRTMRAKIRAKADLCDGRVDLPAALRARTFAEYDRLVTAPIFGFADERDYWERSSSAPFLARIRRPALLINAQERPVRAAGRARRRRVRALAVDRGGGRRRGRPRRISRGAVGRPLVGGAPRPRLPPPPSARMTAVLPRRLRPSGDGGVLRRRRRVRPRRAGAARVLRRHHRAPSRGRRRRSRFRPRPRRAGRRALSRREDPRGARRHGGGDAPRAAASASGSAATSRPWRSGSAGAATRPSGS